MKCFQIILLLTFANAVINVNLSMKNCFQLGNPFMMLKVGPCIENGSSDYSTLSDDSYWTDTKELSKESDSDYWLTSDEIRENDSSDYRRKSDEDPTDPDYWLRSDENGEKDSSDYSTKSNEDPTDSDYWLRSDEVDDIDSSDYWSKSDGDPTDSDYWLGSDESDEDPTNSDYWLSSDKIRDTDYWTKSDEDSNESTVESTESGQKERHPKKTIPYMVSFQRVEKNRGAHFCAGAIIGAFHAVSAAHCFDMLTPSEVYAVVGSMSVLSGDAHNVSHIYRHPKYYQKERLKNNIAVIKVEQPFNFEKRNIKPIRLGTRYMKGDVKVENIGWDKLAYKLKDYPATLKISVARTIDNEQCSRNIPKLPKHTLCVAGREGLTCKGDSGSPLVTTNRSAPKLVGINIMKKSGCSSKLPPVFTRVQGYLKFINNALQT